MSPILITRSTEKAAAMDELVSKQGEKVFGSADSIDRIATANKGTTARFWLKLQDMIHKAGLNSTERTEYNRLRKMENLFANAITEKYGGDFYRTLKSLSGLDKKEIEKVMREIDAEVNKNSGTVDFDGGKVNKNGDLRFAIKESADGTKYVEIETPTELQEQLDNAKSIIERRKIVRNWLRTNLKGKFAMGDGGRIVILSTKGIKEMTNYASDLKLKVLPELADLIKVAKLDNVVNVTHDSFIKFAYYKTQFKIGDYMYGATINIGIANNNQATLYEVNEIQEKSNGFLANNKSADASVATFTNIIRTPAANSQQNLEKNAKGENVNDSDNNISNNVSNSAADSRDSDIRNSGQGAAESEIKDDRFSLDGDNKKGDINSNGQSKQEHARERANEILYGGQRRANSLNDIRRISESARIQDRIFATLQDQEEYAKIIRQARLYEDKTYHLKDGTELSIQKIDDDALTDIMKEMREENEQLGFSLNFVIGEYIHTQGNKILDADNSKGLYVPEINKLFVSVDGQNQIIDIVNNHERMHNIERNESELYNEFREQAYATFGEGRNNNYWETVRETVKDWKLTSPSRMEREFLAEYFAGSRLELMNLSEEQLNQRDMLVDELRYKLAKKYNIKGGLKFSLNEQNRTLRTENKTQVLTEIPSKTKTLNQRAKNGWLNMQLAFTNSQAGIEQFAKKHGKLKKDALCAFFKEITSNFYCHLTVQCVKFPQF